MLNARDRAELRQSAFRTVAIIAAAAALSCLTGALCYAAEARWCLAALLVLAAVLGGALAAVCANLSGDTWQ